MRRVLFRAPVKPLRAPSLYGSEDRFDCDPRRSVPSSDLPVGYGGRGNLQYPRQRGPAVPRRDTLVIDAGPEPPSEKKYGYWIGGR
jgi:hypothetical protein